MTQRDLSKTVSFGSLQSYSVSLTSAYFNNTDYSTTKLKDIGRILNLGYRRLLLDIYWGLQGNWQICPQNYQQVPVFVNGSRFNDVLINGIICTANSTGSLQMVLESLSNWIKSTDNIFQMDVITVILNPIFLNTGQIGINDPQINNLTVANSSLSNIIYKTFGKYLYLPSHLQLFRNIFQNELYVGSIISPVEFWPSLGDLLISGKRIIVGFSQDDIKPYYSVILDTDVLFSAYQINGYSTSNYVSMINTKSPFCNNE